MDMIGHTGNFDATVQTMETVDICTEKIVSMVNQLSGTTIVLADHGNADEMFTIKNGKKEIKTAHTLNPVPCAIITNNTTFKKSQIQDSECCSFLSSYLLILNCVSGK